MQLSGIAHIQLTVGDLPRARAFWKPLLELFEMKVLVDAETIFYCVGSRTGVALSPADPAHAGERFAQRRVGLHHVCFRARERADVDAIRHRSQTWRSTAAPRVRWRGAYLSSASRARRYASNDTG